MRSTFTTVVFLLTLFYSVGVNGQDESDKGEEKAPANAEQAGDAEKAGNAKQAEKADDPTPLTLGHRFHGVRLDADGILRGVTTRIDPSTLKLVPHGNVAVIFAQEGRVIDRTTSDAQGRFQIKGLTPRAVYSVISRSSGDQSSGDDLTSGFDSVGGRNTRRPMSQPWFSAFAVAVFPNNEQVAGAPKNTRFASLFQDDENAVVGNQLIITSIPQEDLNLVDLPEGQEDTPPGTLPLNQPSGGVTGGGSGGAGGNGGGGGALVAAAAAAAIVAAGNNNPPAASPFIP